MPEGQIQLTHSSLQTVLWVLKRNSKFQRWKGILIYHQYHHNDEKHVKRIVMIYSVPTVCLAICLYYSIESSPQPRRGQGFLPQLRKKLRLTEVKSFVQGHTLLHWSLCREGNHFSMYLLRHRTPQTPPKASFFSKISPCSIDQACFKAVVFKWGGGRGRFWHLTMSLDIFGCHTDGGREGALLASSW